MIMLLIMNNNHLISFCVEYDVQQHTPCDKILADFFSTPKINMIASSKLEDFSDWMKCICKLSFPMQNILTFCINMLSTGF